MCKSIVQSLWIAFCLSLTSVTLHASEPDSPFDEARAMAEWSLNVSTLTTEIVSVFTDPHFETLMVTLTSEEDYQVENLMEIYRAWRKNTDETIARLDIAIPNSPPPPELTQNKDMRPGLVKRYESLPVLYEDIKLAVSQSETFVKRAINNEVDGLNKLRVLQLRSLKTALETETESAKPSLKSLPSGHPNYYVIKLSLNANDFIAHGLDMKILHYGGQSGATDRTPHVKAVRAIIQDSENMVQKGRQVIETNLQTFADLRKGNISESDHKALDFAQELIETYRPAMDVEEEIISAQRDMLSTYERDDTFGNIETDVDTSVNALTAMFNRRLTLEAERHTLIAKAP